MWKALVDYWFDVNRRSTLNCKADQDNIKIVLDNADDD
jgi:hypothetical protein